MPAHHILIIAVDGFRASALGAYGNTAFPTPALDEMAAESFLFDSCFAPAAELPAIYRALWQAVHPLRTDEYAAGAASLASLLSERGYHTTLVTDAAEVAALPAAAGFDACVQVSGEADRRAVDVSHTALARLSADACELIAGPHGAPQLVWVHSRGMYGPWDAPPEFQQMLLDEDDPPPVETVAPPDLVIADADDPDTAFRYGVAYAAQVMVLDACWEALRDAVRAAGPNGEWLVMLLGVRGFPLGEHRRVGGVDPRLYADQLHVPWLVRFPDGAGRLARSGRLVSPLDLLPTLVDWTDGDNEKDFARCDGRSVLPLVRPASLPWRDALVFGSGASANRAIRTPGWSLHYEASRGAEERPNGGELFVRPDDRWEANDVATLCPDVVDGLTAVGEKITARIQAGDAMPDEPLAMELRNWVG